MEEHLLKGRTFNPRNQSIHGIEEETVKKAFSVAIMVGLVAASLAVPAEAAKKKKAPKRVERVVEWKYEAPALGSPDSGGVCLRPTMSCIDIATGATERYITIEATDATGTAIAIEIGQDTDPAAFGTEHNVGVVCGKTTEPLEIQPGAPIVGFPWALGGITCPGGFATNGTIKAVLSNLP